MSLNLTFILDLGSEIVVIYMGILIGYLFGKSRYYSESLSHRLSQLGVYIIFPPIIILNTLSVGEGQISEMLGVLGFSMVLHLFLLGISILTLKNRTPLEKGSSILTATFPNAIGYSFPIIAALLGVIGWVPATMFAMGARLIISTAGGAVALNYSTKSDKTPNFFENLWRLLKFPLFLSGFIGLFLRGTMGSVETTQYLPVIVWQYIGVSLGLILIGLDCKTLTASIILQGSLNRSSIIRFVVSPLITIISCLLLRFPRLIAVPLIIQSWGPPAIMTILYSEFFGLDTRITSRNVTLFTFVALLLLPIEIFVILWLYPT